MLSTVCIGVPVHNGAATLSQSLDALLGQTYRDFRVVILDDGSTDDSYELLKRYADADQRIRLERNLERTGLIRAWNKVAQLAAVPQAPQYFAWYSDHDWVEPDWLELLVQALEQDSSAVLAHARTVLVDADGALREKPEQGLDTSRLTPLEAVRRVSLETYGAGDAVYGLFRYEALERIGFFPMEVMPDRLAVSEICLHGHVRHVLAATRYRRDFRMAEDSQMIQQQMQTLFSVESERPLLPYISHGTYFLRKASCAEFYSKEFLEPAYRHLHALLYAKKQIWKFLMQWQNEFQRGAEVVGMVCGQPVVVGVVVELLAMKAENAEYVAKNERLAQKKIHLKSVAVEIEAEKNRIRTESRETKRILKREVERLEGEVRELQEYLQNASLMYRFAWLAKPLLLRLYCLLQRTAKMLGFKSS